MKLRKPVEAKIGRRINVGQNFSMKSSYYRPKGKTAKRRYSFDLRSNDNKRWRLYAIQASPGTVKIHFVESK